MWLIFDYRITTGLRRLSFKSQHTYCLSLHPISPDHQLLPHSITSTAETMRSPLLAPGPPTCWSYWKTVELLKEDGEVLQYS